MQELSSRLKVESFVSKTANPRPLTIVKRESYHLPTGTRHWVGCPTPDKETLVGIRNDLVHFLSVSWAEIGWHLRHANSREDLRRAFGSLRGKNSNPLIERFLTTTAAAPTGEELRLTRRALSEAIKHRQAAQARTLEKQLAQQEVRFAQGQLVRILREGRCACNPLRLANAMTGLILLTARVSYNRCSKMKCAMWPEFDFQVFEKIELIWNSRHRYRDLSVVELYRQEIKKLPGTMRRNNAENRLRTRLAEDFGHLKLAIEQSLESSIDSDQMPFLITSSFNNNRQSPAPPLTLTLAANERID
jgi:hypothetical protein